VTKFKIKNIITEVPLYCIASFLIGAYTVLLINFFYFDNHITPPGVSAFIACMALGFTIYAAFKVKEWNDAKINEKGFSKCEYIIEKLGDFNLKFITVHSYVSYLLNIHKDKFIPGFIDDRINNYNDIFISDADEANMILLRILSGQHHLKIWNYRIRNDFRMESLNELYDSYRKEISMAFEMINDANHEMHDSFLQKVENINKAYLNICSKTNNVFNSEFSEIFYTIQKSNNQN